MKRCRVGRGDLRPIFALVSLIALIRPAAVSAHEPLFSLGPHTIYEGGIGIEFETEFALRSTLRQNGDKISDPKDQRAASLRFPIEVIYGVTPDLSLTARIPWVYRVFEQTDLGMRTRTTAHGLGDVSLRAKYRFWRRDRLGVQESAALVFGVKLPTGDDAAGLPLGSGAADLLFGLTAGHEGRRLYLFGDLRYRLATAREGDRFFYDAAIGFRPVLTGYDRPDLVLLLEMNGEVIQKDRHAGKTDFNSGGEMLWLGPNFLLSYRNLMLKGGVRYPIVRDLSGVQLAPDYEGVMAIEVHF